MTINDAAVLSVGDGNYLTAVTGTAMPVSLTNPASPWAKVGHTSLEDIFGASSDGGEASVLATLQNRSLRTTYSSRIETFNITLQQFDTPSLKLYYGSNAVILADKSVGVPSKPIPTTCAFLAVFLDGSNAFGIYAPKAEIIRGDDLSIGDTDSLAGLPLSIKPLAYQTNTWTYAVTPLGDAA